MLRISRFIIVIIIISFLASCSEQTAVEVAKFKKDIPARFNDRPELFYALSQQRALQLKIDTLQSGFDSLQIRIWYDYALFDLRELLIIRCTNASWSAATYIMKVDWDSSSNAQLKPTNIKIVTPKNGWDSFTAKLFALQIMSLPDMDNIPGLRNGWADGVSYNVEVATKKIYRYYSYHMPDKFADKYSQARNMTNILKLAEEELGISSGIHELPYQ